MKIQTTSFTSLVMHYSIIFSFLFILMFAFSSALKAQDAEDNSAFKMVVAQGVGAGPGRAKARDEAITDAQRKAVEQGVGLYIKSETLVENLTLVSDTIYKESAGFVYTYVVEAENYNADTDMYWVRINAKVSLQRIEATLVDLCGKLKIAGQPKVIILINGTTSLREPDGVVNALTNSLVEKGFTVLDEDQLTAVRQKDALRLIRNGEIDAKTVMLLQDKADLIIVGKVSADTPERLFDDPVTYSQKVTLDAKIIRVDTAEILGAKRGLGVGADFSTKSAMEAAEDKAGNDYLEKNLCTLLRAVMDPCKEYTIKVTGCSYTQMTAVDNKLALSRFIRPPTDARFEDGYGVITVQFNGNAKMLATHLETTEGIKLKIISVTAMTVMVKPVQ